MKKILVMSALAAISTAFVACSNENDLVQQKPEVPEETTVGYPMHVSVADTRGTDLTKATLPGFTMYSAMQKDNATDWQTGVAFTNNNGNCSKVTLADTDFPDNTNTYYFFAISDPGNIADIAENEGIGDGNPDVVISNNGQSFSFNYAVPTDYTTYEGDIKAANITGGQKDLLVATATGNGADGEVSLTFDHALALISKVYIRANATRIQSLGILDKDVSESILEYKIFGPELTICNVNTVGTYTFGATPAWTNQSTLGEISIPVSTTTFVPFSDEWLEIPLSAGDNGAYVLPQTLSGTLTDNNDGSGTYTLAGAYIKVNLQVYQKSDTYNGTDDLTGEYFIHKWWPANASGGGTGDGDIASEEYSTRPFCVPLQFTLLPNKTYAIKIDLTRGAVLGTDDKYYPLIEGMDISLSN